MRIRPTASPTASLRASLVCASALAVIVVGGCGPKKKKAPPVTMAPKYQRLDPRPVPAWLKGSIFEQVDLENIQPYRVSTYGLVAMKNPTGGGGVVGTPNPVREYMIRQMTIRGFGSKNIPGFETLTPDQVLRDPRVAIVRVDGFIPAGATKGQRIDVQVTALDDSNTTSLATANLFTCDLAPNGANPQNPGNTVDVYANAHGPVFVNPEYALDPKPEDPVHRRSLTAGVILNGGRIARERPIGFLIRSAEGRMSKMTEYRIDQLFGSAEAASAQDEGRVYGTVPASYRGDWEHYAGVVLHTFYNADATFAAVKARDLVDEAQKQDAPLLDISYTWEALGKPALPSITPLFTHAKHEVAFAAARAAAFIGDNSAESALASMARDSANPFRVNAVQTLSALPVAPAINMALRDLLTIDDALVRVEAYKGLVRNGDTSVFSKPIGDKFMLDIVPNEGPPLVYASRVGVARIAFIGSTARLPSPTFFSAMNDEFSISPVEENKNLLTLFYRGRSVRTPVKTLTTPDLAEIVARLGGEGPGGQPRLDFGYGEIVAMLGRFSDNGMIVSSRGTQQKANFVLQDLPGFSRDVNTAPVIPEGPRPVAATSDQPPTP